MYTCGPTVYHFAHIGNLRTYVSNDILKRMFLANGYQVKHIMNFTDVGHLTSDADTGEDKMEKGSRREGKSVWEIAKYYTDVFLNDIKKLNILPATKYTPATQYIQEQIDLVKKLEDLGYTYKIEGDGIYYDTSKFADYWKLGGQKLDDLKAGARIEFADGKRNVADFALWKFSPKDEKRQMEWDSPWGVGFPGWHIECSAMSLAEIGDRMDVHTGGVDHIKVHHTNEIAQVEPVVGHKWVNYWVHMEFLNDLSGKMSKSNGDFLTLSKLEEMGYPAIVYRYFLLMASYRKQITFSYELLDGAKNSYENLVKKVSSILKNADGSFDKVVVENWKKRILETLNNDINTAGAIVILQELLKSEETLSTKVELIKFFDDILGLNLIENAKKLINTDVDIPVEITKMAEDRLNAKKSKNYALADELRTKISDAGYIVEDTSDGFKIKVK
ncbi:MAG: cysteine--tRNA ligase, partial [Alphaproteobacteria bacterium]|nr:cysteine--tRNA ligase [Alphaproteobacteria bacterium]